MNRIIVLILAAAFGLTAHKSNAQSSIHHVFATAGNDFQNEQYILSWTLGESIIDTYTSETYIVTQGFHQPQHVLSSSLGDANCDGAVDVLDVVTVISYILENNPNPFCPEWADVNEDNVIDILDAVAIINIILAQSKSLLLEDNTTPAHLHLSSSGIHLESEGNLAGLQFEFYGQDIPDVEIDLKGFQFLISKAHDKAKVVIVSMSNQTLPKGNISLLSFKSTPINLVWGQATAASQAANRVHVFKHLDQNTGNSQLNFSMNVYPNPSIGKFNLQFHLPKSSQVQLTLTDMLGKQTTTIHQALLHQGHNNIQFDLSDHSPGIYTLRAVIKEVVGDFIIHHYFQKIVITKQ